MKIASCVKSLVIFLFILFSRNIFAQVFVRDSLLLKLTQESVDTCRVKLMIQLGLNFAVPGLERDRYLSEAYYLARETNYRYGIFFGEYYEGMLLCREGRYREAIDKYKRCIDGLDSLGIIQTSGFPLNGIGNVFNLAGLKTEKFRYYSDKVIFYKNNGPVQNTANCFHGIASYYLYLADYDKAIGYYMRARDTYKTFDPQGFENEQECIGTAYLEWGNLDKAEEYLKSALNYLKQMNQEYISFYCYQNLGDIYFKRQNYQQALKYYHLAESNMNDGFDRTMIFVNFAAVYLQLNSPDSSYYYLVEADKIRQQEKLEISSGRGYLEIAYNFYNYYFATGNLKCAHQSLTRALNESELSKHLLFMAKYSRELHSFLLKQGDSLQALRYLVQYNAIKDSMNTRSLLARTASYEIEQQQQQQESEITQLQTQKATQRNFYLAGGAFLILIVLAAFSRFRYKRKRDEEQLTTDFKKQLAQAETKALRSQMNPHFIFNCLNSINSLVMDEKHEIASDYLIKFSKLIRLILDNSRSETITIEKELETLKLYVTLESARFDNKFKCIFSVSENVNTSSIMIPPMLLQPFVENAIWHGLMQKETEGTITIGIRMEGEEAINISITDDGIGREKAAELKSKSATHKSHGLKVTSQRIEMMNKLNSTGAQVNIFDLHDESGKATGTKVELIIPV